MSKCALLEISDVPAMMVGLPAEAFQELQKAYALFCRPDVGDEVILDAIGFDEEEIKKLSGVIGAAAAEECQGQYVIFYVN